MDNQQHLSNEIKNLAEPLKRELESLPPSSSGCCIYKVPESQRRLDPSDYTPNIVSIGPFHHDKEKFKIMEEHKRRYLKYFLQRTTVSMEEFLAKIKENEVKIRNCYSEIIDFESDEFVKMILLDSIFLIEFSLRTSYPDLRIGDDFWRIMNMELRDDFLLLENQIPLFILNDLFNLFNTTTRDVDYEELSFYVIACRWFRRDILHALPIKDKLEKMDHSQTAHFLDMFILCLQPCKSCGEIARKDLTLPGAKELGQAGVKFKSISSENPLEIIFNNGVLELPYLQMKKILLRNLVVFESLHHDTRYLNDYILTMGLLIRSPKDAELLIENEILYGQRTDYIADTIDSLSDSTGFRVDSFQYSTIFTELHKHRKVPRNKWKATLKQNYFNTPWASISVIAAALLLLLTIIQTVCSIIQL